MTLDINTGRTSSHSGAIFELISRDLAYDGSIIELKTASNSSALIKSVVQGESVHNNDDNNATTESNNIRF